MKSIRKWIRDIFGFSGNEINGFLILIPLMVLLLISEPLYHGWVARRGYQDAVRDSVLLDSLAMTWAGGERRNRSLQDVEKISLFPFDPNTASVEELRNLGVDERSATYIAAYRRKGGVFRVKSDLMRIYGLDSSLYKRLYSYISLPPRRLPDSSIKRAKKEVTGKFDINTADTLQLKSVYGIGSRLAARIVKFRDALGGFVKREQLSEVYGLDSMTVRRLLEVSFIDADFIPEKININSADEEKLSTHPYIRYKMARLLTSYRFQHGDFTEVTDIKKLSAIESFEVDRLLPYLKVRD